MSHALPLRVPAVQQISHLLTKCYDIIAKWNRNFLESIPFAVKKQGKNLHKTYIYIYKRKGIFFFPEVIYCENVRQDD